MSGTSAIAPSAASSSDSGVPSSTASGPTSGAGSGGSGNAGFGTVGGGRGFGGPGGPNKTGSGFSAWSTKDEDILGILKLLTHLGHAVAGEGEGVQPGPLQEELTKLP